MNSKDKQYRNVAICTAPAALMATGITELISERAEGLDRELPKRRLLRGFGSLTLGGMTGVATAALTKTDAKRKAIMMSGAASCALFAGLLFKGYRCCRW